MNDEPVSENQFMVIEPAEGQAECYWCGGIRKVESMKRDKRHSSVIYVCQGCQ